MTLLVGGLLAVAVAYLLTWGGVATAIAPWALAAGTTAVLAGLAHLAIPRRVPTTSILRMAVALSVTSVLGGFLLALARPEVTTETPIWFGLPRPTAWLVLLVFVVPLVVLPVAYAVAFPREVLRPEERAIGAADAERPA